MTLESALHQLEDRASRQYLSEATIKNYKSKLRNLAKFFPDIAIEDIIPSQMQDFLDTRVKRDKVGYDTIQVHINALKFFYNQVLNQNYDFGSIHNLAKPNQSKQEFFNREEVTRLCEAAETSCDRLIFALMYHFEMDRGDIIKLKAEDAKKQKDGGMALKSASTQRWEKLPASLGNELQNYLATNKPTKWLFEVKGKQLTPEYVHRAFSEALVLAGIHKRLSTKSLGDSHAEHSKQLGVALVDEILANNIRKAPDNFVDPKQIEDLKQIQSETFDLGRLVCLCEELNGCYAHDWFFAASILQRAILDHVPPIFECINFSEVVNNYPWGKSFKTQMEHLQDFARTTADNAVHGMIRNREVLLSQTQVDFRSAMGTLLAEVIRRLR
jgi:site-specific recombinase XerD